MDKKVLTDLITAYSIGGKIENIKLSIANNSLTTIFTSDTKDLVGRIKVNSFSSEQDADWFIFSSSRLQSMLSVLEDEISIKQVILDGNAKQITITDKYNTKVLFNFADESVIPPAPKSFNFPTPDISFSLSKEFIGKFIKALNSIPDATRFAFEVKHDGIVDVIVNYSAITSNNIQFSEEAKTTGTGRVIFSTEYIKELLAINKESELREISISYAGFAALKFKRSDMDINYFMVASHSADN